MKNFYLLLLTATILSPVAFAKHECQCQHCVEYEHNTKKGGFIDINAEPMSIADTKKLPEDSYVTLKGRITKQLSKDTYNFTDEKDNITIEIDKKVWQGELISPKDTITIYGETDNDDGIPVIDVKSIKK